MRNPAIALAFFMIAGSACSQNQDKDYGRLTPACVIVDADGGNLQPLFPYRTRAREFDVSPDGTRIAYVRSGSLGMDIWVANIDGSHARNITNTEAVAEGGPSWSPGGEKIVFDSKRTGDYEIFVMDADGSNVVNVTNHPAGDGGATWSPDGTQLAFSSGRDGAADVYVMNADGSGVRNLTNGFLADARFGDAQWSPDGMHIAFVAIVKENRDIYVLNVNNGTIQQLTDSPMPEKQPTWSPDNSRIAYTRSTPDGTDIMVMNLGGQGTVNITKGIGSNEYPTWTPEGRIVFYTLRESRFLARQFGPAMALVIIETGGLSMELRHGNMAPVQLERVTQSGDVERIPLSPEEARRILQNRGEGYVTIDDRFAP